MNVEEREMAKQYHSQPSVYYKYYPPSGLVALETLSLKCTRPADFSDVLDSFHIESEPEMSGVNVVGSPRYFMASNPLTGLPDEIEREKLREWARRSVVKYPGFRADAVHLVPPMSVDSFQSFVDACRQFSYDEDDRFVLCLTDRWDAPSMWDYYSQGHTGFVIGFRSDASFLSSRPYSTPRRVIYQDKPSSGPHEVAMWRRWLIKSKDYAHEREFRSMYKSDHLVQHEGLNVVRFEKSDLQEVIIGHRASAELVEGIRCCLPEIVDLVRVEVDQEGRFSKSQV